MFKERQEEIAIIIDTIIKVHNFSGEFDEKEFRVLYSEFKKAFPLNTTIKMGTGCTKGVLIFPEYGFVIKIPYICYEDEYLCGSQGDIEWDYCSAEVKYYKDALQNNVEQCFLPLEQIDIIDNIYGIYIQPIATTYLETEEKNFPSKRTKDSVERAKQICSEKYCTCFNSNWLGDIISYYGEKMCSELLTFCEVENIDDLHNENIGYVDNRPVIIDYGNFDN